MNQSASWVVRGQQTTDLLRHEQSHYDITALGACEVHNLASVLTSPRSSEINQRVQQITMRIQTSINQANRRYDTQTNHGINVAAQRRWDASVQNAMGRNAGTIAGLPH